MSTSDKKQRSIRCSDAAWNALRTHAVDLGFRSLAAWGEHLAVSTKRKAARERRAKP